MYKLLADYGISKDSLTTQNTKFGMELENDRIVVVGMKDLPGFEAVTYGTTKDDTLIQNSILEKMSHVLQ